MISDVLLDIIVHWPSIVHRWVWRFASPTFLEKLYLCLDIIFLLCNGMELECLNLIVMSVETLCTVTRGILALLHMRRTRSRLPAVGLGGPVPTSRPYWPTHHLGMATGTRHRDIGTEHTSAVGCCGYWVVFLAAAHVWYICFIQQTLQGKWINSTPLEMNHFNSRLKCFPRISHNLTSDSGGFLKYWFESGGKPFELNQLVN